MKKSPRVSTQVKALQARLAALRRQEAVLEQRLKVEIRKLREGAPAKRKGPGRPPGKEGRRSVNEKPLAEFLREVLANQPEPVSVADLAAGARARGYRTRSTPPVFAITVSLALRKNPALFTRVGRKYELTKSSGTAS